MKRKAPLLRSLFAMAVAAALAIFAPAARQAAAQGLRLCANVVIPSLFPFFVLSGLLVSMDLMSPLAAALSGAAERLFFLSGEAAVPFLLGALGGYPLGVQSAAALYHAGRLSGEEAEQAAKFCNNSGPGFLFGVMAATVLHSPGKGLLLYALHLLGALITGVLLRKPLPQSDGAQSENAPIPFSRALTISVTNAGSTAVTVCAFVVIFSIPAALVQALLANAAPTVRAALVGVLELSGGAAALAEAGLSEDGIFVLSAFLVSFGGLSVLAQSAAILHAAGLSAKGLLSAKLLQSAITAALAALCCLPRGVVFPALAAAFSAFAVFSLIFRELRTGNRKRKRV